MTDAVLTAPAAAPAPAAPSAPAPAPSAPAPSPASSAPAAAPAGPAPVATPGARTIGTSGVKSAIDPNQFVHLDDYANAVFAEKMAEIPAVVEEPAATAVEVPADPAQTADPVVADPATPDPVAADPAAADPAAVAADTKTAGEEDFDLDPPAIVTPELLSKMVTDNPDFGKLLENDSRLKGQLYKTAREAAELKPYRDLFPDLDAAKAVVEQASSFSSVRSVFMGSTTKDGAKAALAKIAELTYERDDNGNVVTKDGKPVVGKDFEGFVANTVALDLDDRAAAVEARLKANRYHIGVETQEQADEAYARDQRLKAALDEIRGQVMESPAEPQLPAALQKQKEELDRRERELNEKTKGQKVQSQASFDHEIQTETNARIFGTIDRILNNVTKQGGVIPPYLADGKLQREIAFKLIDKLAKMQTVTDQMEQLQRLGVSPDARQRRLAAVDRQIQQYVPDIIREELRAAGVHIVAGGTAKAEKIAGQAATTQRTEIPGSRSTVTNSAAPMTAEAAYAQAEAEWQKANPGKFFDSGAKQAILPRAMELMLPRGA